MKRVIITGATGAIGMALIRELIRHDIEVLVLAREGSARNSQLPKDRLVTVRYCSLDQLKDLQNTDERPYDVFYHFAWDGTTGNARNDMALQTANIAYSLDAVQAAHRLGCRAFIGAGSQAEYGRAEGILTANTPTHPEMGYGIGKLCAGMMTRELCHQLGMRHVWIRVLSVYGPYDGMQSMVMSTIRCLKEGISPKFTKGKQMWDYLFSEDAACAFRRAGEDGIDGKTYVLGNGTARQLSAYIEEIRDMVAPEVELKFGEIPYSDKQVMFLQADIGALRKDLQWEPQYGFREGIAKILDVWEESAK